MSHRPSMFMTKQLKPEEMQILFLAGRLPGRLTTGEAAAILGFAEHDIPILVSRGLLKPLGRPSPNATKYFSSVLVTQHSSDPAWLDRATVAIAKHWQAKNQRKNSRCTA